MRGKMIKRGPKMAKMRGKMTKRRPKMAKLRPKIAKPQKTIGFKKFLWTRKPPKKVQKLSRWGPT